MTPAPTECVKHGPHAPGVCPTCDAVAEACSVIAFVRIPDECPHMYAAPAGSEIGEGVCIKCGAAEPPDSAPPALAWVPVAIKDCPKCDNPAACEAQGHCMNWSEVVERPAVSASEAQP